MFGKCSPLNPIESRKQLLITESELNRAQMGEEWHLMTHEIRHLARRAKTVAAWASSAALVIAGVSALRGGPPVPGTVKPSWFQKILKGARVVSTIWFAFRAPGEKAEPR